MVITSFVPAELHRGVTNLIPTTTQEGLFCVARRHTIRRQVFKPAPTDCLGDLCFFTIRTTLTLALRLMLSYSTHSFDIIFYLVSPVFALWRIISSINDNFSHFISDVVESKCWVYDEVSTSCLDVIWLLSNYISQKKSLVINNTSYTNPVISTIHITHPQVIDWH